MLRGIHRLSLIAASVAILAGGFYAAVLAQNPPADPAPNLDPPLPPGSADGLEARMRARRDAQAARPSPPDVPIPASGNTGGFGGGMGGVMGGMGGMGGGAGFRPTPAPHLPAGVDAASNIPDGMSAMEFKKMAPVFTGADPAQIELSNKLITQIIPLKNISAGQMRNDLMPIFSADCDVTANAASNSLIITDVSHRIHRMVEVIATLDRLAADRPVTLGRGGTQRLPLPPPAAANGTLQTTGILGAATADIRVPFDAAVTNVLAKDGQSVKKDDPLFQFSRTDSPVNATTPGTAQETVLAPFDGIVFGLDAVPGMTAQRGAILAKVVHTQLKVDFTVRASDLPLLRVGLPFTFQASAVGDNACTGEIAVISPIVEHTTQTVATQTTEKPVDIEIVSVRGQLTGITGSLRSGMSGTVTLKQNP